MIEVSYASGASSWADFLQSASTSSSIVRIPQSQPMLNLGTAKPITKHRYNATTSRMKFQMTIHYPDMHFQLHTNVFL